MWLSWCSWMGLRAFSYLEAALTGACGRLDGHVGRWAQVRLPYHIRVLVPCYKEELGIVQRTVLAALAAHLPGSCARTVYLCDDGRDAEKRRWVASLGRHDLLYVAGRMHIVGETNGKSGNVNNATRQIYPTVLSSLHAHYALLCMQAKSRAATLLRFR